MTKEERAGGDRTPIAGPAATGTWHPHRDMS
jgi:hypothetical protein